VLNAQLQTAIAVRDYAELAADPVAAELATRLELASATLLPAFDTGAWSLYALNGREATLGYHTYVVSLLKRLANRTQDPLWRDPADRFDAYTKQPVAVTPVGPPVPALYPLPPDGFRDEARIGITLSKLATVTVEAAGRRETRSLPRGRHVFVFRPGPMAPGVHPARLRAVDPAGNVTELELPSLDVRRDTTPPEILAAAVKGGVLTWRVRDAETPWVRLRVELRGAKGVRRLDLGRRQQTGWARLAVPRGWWAASLRVEDSSGNTATARVGRVVGR
jgi:hypothetical protein